MPPARILVIDNDKRAVTDLKSRLMKLGYEVVGTATTSEEALRKSAQLKPELILSNTSLTSGTDGIQTGRLIHAEHDTPIVYIAAQGSQTTIRRASTTGPFGYIVKPFDDLQLFATVEIALTRHSLERQLTESRQWLNGVLMSIGEGVIAVDRAGLIQFINPEAERITGWDNYLAINTQLYKVFRIRDEKSGEIVDLSAGRLNPREDLFHAKAIEAVLFTRDDRRIPVEIFSKSILDQNHGLQGMVISFRDMTEKRRAIDQIRRQVERAEALVQIAKLLNSRFDLKEVLGAVCTATNQIMKTSASIIFLYDVKANSFRDIAHRFEDDIPLAQEHHKKVSFSREELEKYMPEDYSAFAINEVNRRRDIPIRGLLRLLKIERLAVIPITRNDDLVGTLICGSTLPGKFSGQDLAYLTGLAEHIMIAITNTRLFENVRQGRERQRLLSKSVIDIQEAERRRIARELHDHLGQELTGVQFSLESIKNQMDESLRSGVDGLQETVKGTISRVREMSLNLRPSMLDDLGLIPTLKWHMDRYSHQTGIRVNFDGPKTLRRYPEDVEITAYRIIQEALTNVARHSGATEVFVGVASDDLTVWLEVVDRGRGFDVPATLGNPTSGLSGMVERAALAGGQLSINSYINQGTHIIASLPLGDKPIERRKSERNHPSGR